MGGNGGWQWVFFNYIDKIDKDGIFPFAAGPGQAQQQQQAGTGQPLLRSLTHVRYSSPPRRLAHLHGGRPHQPLPALEPQSLPLRSLRRPRRYPSFHAGAEVAAFVERHFVTELEGNKNYQQGRFEDGLRQTFMRMDVLLAAEEGRREVVQIQK